MVIDFVIIQLYRVQIVCTTINLFIIDVGSEIGGVFEIRVSGATGECCEEYEYGYNPFHNLIWSG